MSEGPFEKRVVVWLVVICALSLALGLGLAVIASEFAPDSTGADAFSRSAIGHQGLVEVLRRLDVPVIVSRHGSARKAGQSGLLVLAEPRIGSPRGDGARALRAMLSQAPATLLVLPKWRGVRSEDRPDWIADIELVEADTVNALLRVAGVDAAIGRVAARGAAFESATVNDDLPSPGASPLQILEGPDIEGHVTRASGGALLARSLAHENVWILADPDVLSNAGLGRGANARFVVDLLNRLRRGDAGVVFDETLHGHVVTQSVWRELFAFPLVLVTIHLALLLALLLWAAMGRFGAPQRSPPPLQPGTHFLVESTADLLRHGKRAPIILTRYLDATLRRVRRELRAPLGLEGKPLEAWLDRVAARRGAQIRIDELRAEASAAAGRPSQVLVTARRIRRWREEILSGP